MAKIRRNRKSRLTQRKLRTRRSLRRTYKFGNLSDDEMNKIYKSIDNMSLGQLINTLVYVNKKICELNKKDLFCDKKMYENM